MKSDTSGRRRAIKAAAVFLLVVIGGVFLLHSCPLTRNLVLRRPYYRSFSGPIEDGQNALGTYGTYKNTLAFSPNAKHVAYIWQDASYAHTAKYEGRPSTLTESMELRIRSLNDDTPELKIPLDSIDLRPEGSVYFGLGVGLQMSPDSRWAAALCARRLVLADVSSGAHRTIEYDGEFFGSLSWLGSDEIAFSTFNATHLTFWRYRIDDPLDQRENVYSELPSPPYVHWGEELPPKLRDDKFSPNGRFVAFKTFTKSRNKGEDALLDLRTGDLHKFPFSLRYQCWKPDSTAVLVSDKFGAGSPFYLIDPTIGEWEDITRPFSLEFGSTKDITFVSSLWTLDGEYVVLYSDVDSSARLRGCVVRPVPFKVVLSKNKILRWSPFPGWFLLQRQMRFKWIDISGQKTAPIRGWVNDWTWSHDGKLAARIDDGQVKVFSPELPPGVE